MKRVRISLAAGVLAALTACTFLPEERAAPAPAPRGPSAESTALAQFYAKREADYISRGLLRTDGGGIDTPYSASMLARNFERIAFYDEYQRGAGLQRASFGQTGLRRWRDPVQVSVSFGSSVDAAQRAEDNAEITRYLARLARITGHPISRARENANFHILVMGADDRADASARLRAVVPNASTATEVLFRNPPRAIHCLAAAFSDTLEANAYKTTVVLIRAEHPDLIRRSCIHEEIAQGLGLANDSPRARPSIFNDDNEFALLTSMDEKMLAMLYDPRLRIGMSAGEARPLLRSLAQEQLGDSD